MQKHDYEKPTPLPKDISDAGIQTADFTRSDESCQRDSFEILTDSETDSVPELTVKQEIDMPNTPNSVAQTPTKKRKLSSISSSPAVTTNLASNDVSLPRIRSGFENKMSDELDLVRITKGSYCLDKRRDTRLPEINLRFHMKIAGKYYEYAIDNMNSSTINIRCVVGNSKATKECYGSLPLEELR